jgi:phosphoglucosamine mutase
MVDVMENALVKQAVTDIEAELADAGRVLLRASGTEPVIRVMVEGRDALLTNKLAKQLADVIEAQLA